MSDVYYVTFPNDRRISKGIVLFTYVIETLQTVLATRDAFRNFGTGWGDMRELDAVGWLWFSVPVLGSIISCLGQVFYAWRIAILSQQYWVSGAILILSLLQCGTGLYTGAQAHIIGIFSQMQIHQYKTTTIWLGGTALCDIIIAVSMMFIRVTVETGLICATFAILDLALFLAYKENNYHLAPSIALSKLYSNSLLAVFNARVRIVGGRNTDSSIIGATSVSSEIARTARSLSTSQGVKTFRPKSSMPVNTISVEISQIRDVDDDIEAHLPIELKDTKYVDSSLAAAKYDNNTHPYV